LPRLAITRAETAMVVKQKNEAVLCKRLRERLDPWLLHASVTVRHGDHRIGTGPDEDTNSQPRTLTPPSASNSTFSTLDHLRFMWRYSIEGWPLKK